MTSRSSLIKNETLIEAAERAQKELKIKTKLSNKKILQDYLMSKIKRSMPKQQFNRSKNELPALIKQNYRDSTIKFKAFKDMKLNPDLSDYLSEVYEDALKNQNAPEKIFNFDKEIQDLEADNHVFDIHFIAEILSKNYSETANEMIEMHKKLKDQLRSRLKLQEEFKINDKAVIIRTCHKHLIFHC